MGGVWQATTRTEKEVFSAPLEKSAMAWEWTTDSCTSAPASPALFLGCRCAGMASCSFLPPELKTKVGWQQGEESG